MMMTNQAIVKRMFRVFDELHFTYTEAQQVLSGWEHKEKITEVFAVGYANELNHDFINLELSKGIYLSTTLEGAYEEAKEWNE